MPDVFFTVDPDGLEALRGQLEHIQSRMQDIGNAVDSYSVHSRGAGNWCQLTAGSGGSQGFPAMASRMASSAVMPWAAAVSR